MDTLISDVSTEAAKRWLGDFEAALTSADTAAVAALFATECFWRDILAFNWNLRTTAGADAIAKRLMPAVKTFAPRNLQLAEGRTLPRAVTRAGTACLEVIFSFETTVGPCVGTVRLVSEAGTGERSDAVLRTAMVKPGHDGVHVGNLTANTASR